MSQLSFFDVDLSQPVKVANPIISGSPSKIDTKTDKTVEKATLTTANTQSKRDFHTEFIQLFNQTARYHSRLEPNSRYFQGDLFPFFAHRLNPGIEPGSIRQRQPLRLFTLSRGAKDRHASSLRELLLINRLTWLSSKDALRFDSLAASRVDPFSPSQLVFR